MTVPETVRKRDGRLEQFKEQKLAESVYRAMLAADLDDFSLAVQWAGLVGENVRKEKNIARAGELHETVVKVLTETGHLETAQAFESLRILKESARKRLWLRPDASYTGSLFRVAEQGAPGREYRWKRHALQKNLARDLGLGDSLADEISRTVEARLLATGLDGFTPELVTELVNHELYEHGIPRRAGGWSGIPDTAGSAFLFPAPGRNGLSPPRPAGVENHLAAGYISQEIVEAHRAGLIFLEGFAYGACLGRLALDAEQLAGEIRDGHEAPETTAAKLAGAVCSLASLSLQPVTFLGFGKWLQKAQPQDGLRRAAARAFFAAVLASDRASPMPAPVVIRIGSARSQGDFSVVNALAELGAGAFREVLELQSMFPGGRCPPQVRLALELVEEGLTQAITYLPLRPFYSLPAVAINLPGTAFGCAGDGLAQRAEFFDRLNGRVDLALLAHAEWREWQRRQLASDGRLGRLASRCGLDRFLRSRRKWRAPLTPVGLHPAASHLAAENIDLTETAVEILRGMESRSMLMGHSVHLESVLDPGPSPHAAERFSIADTERYTAARGYLMTGKGIRPAYEPGPDWTGEEVRDNPWNALMWHRETREIISASGAPLEILCRPGESVEKEMQELADLLRTKFGVMTVRFVPESNFKASSVGIELSSFLKLCRERVGEPTLFDILENPVQ